MCFSATASFTLSSVLLPIGGWCIQKVCKSDRHFLPLAAFPVAFGIQQAIEGWVWLAIEANDSDFIHQAATGFVLFSHGFWLVWPAFMVSMLEERPRLRRVWQALALVGVCYAAYLLVPLIFHPDWLMVDVHNQSLHYSLKVLLSGPILKYFGQMLYVSLILTPLLLAKPSVVQGLGWLVLGSLVVTSYWFSYGFVSIWCYFAAVTSLYIGYRFYQGVEPAMESPQA